MRFPLSFVTSATRDEFLRLLPAAVGGEDFSVGDDVVSGRSGWQIRLTVLPEIGFGKIALARLQVDIGFAGWREAEIDAFMRRFSLHFQRGGG